ncbi:MAG: phosphodiester glycosidase family protein, partial [Chloroflexi bacterium]|nr:phosphodiester glycosidase family protein [Chloroflexota bacterium]
GFTSKPPDTSGNPSPANCSPVKPNGFAASCGNIYSELNKNQPVLYISRDNEVTFNAQPGDVYNALSGTQMLINNGKIEESLPTDESVISRTAVGLSKNGRFLILVVVDSRQPDHGEGAALSDLANLMHKFSAFNAMNLGGGESSTMVIEGINGSPRRLNLPHGGRSGQERAVANHLGIHVNIRKNERGADTDKDRNQ